LDNSLKHKRSIVTFIVKVTFIDWRIADEDTDQITVSELIIFAFIRIKVKIEFKIISFSLATKKFLCFLLKCKYEIGKYKVFCNKFLQEKVKELKVKSKKFSICKMTSRKLAKTKK
jgi:nucleoside-triphosphatase THEP1